MRLAEDSGGEPDLAAFEVLAPAPDAPSTPLIFASPHSGRIYPAALLDASRLDPQAIRRSEDAHVDALLAGAPALGVTVLAARLARAYVDLNRDPWELDQAMFEDALPAFARSKTARVSAGLGAIPRVVGAGREIYHGKLRLTEARARIEAAHGPYHEALAALLAERRRRHGVGLLIDWHSMPSAAARAGGKAVDIVLGDRFGVACSSGLTALVEARLGAMGYRLARNAPYAGGYISERHGRPSAGTHALQIEINRAIYMDEASLEPHAGLAALRADIAGVTADLAREWANL